MVRPRALRWCLLALFVCATQQVALAAPEVRFSELHYDNVGTDAGEAIEISAPAGTDLTGWQVILYNGNGGASYDTRTLSGPVPATCAPRGVLVLNYPTNGIQNGGAGATDTSSPDAIALVDASGAVVEFLSYEGVLTATDGPALGLSSTDIGVREVGAEPAGQSLARTAADMWNGPAPSTFGACNDNGNEPPPAEVASVVVTPASATITVGATTTFAASALADNGSTIPGVSFTWTSSLPSVATVSSTGVVTGVSAGDAVITASAPNGVLGTALLRVNAPTGIPNVRISEIHYDNAGTDTGEAIEIEGPAGASIAGFRVVLYNGNGGVSYNTTTLSGTIPATCDARGVVVINYPQDGLQNGSPDGIALVDAAGQLIEFLSYEGTFTATDGPAAGAGSIDIIASQSSAPLGQSLQRDSFNVWQLATSTFNSCNGTGTQPPTGNTISFTGRTPSDPPLPVGFQDQLFATVRDSNNVVIPTTITWTSEAPDIARIDQNGVFTALAAGTAVVRATAADGTTTATFSLPTRVAVASTTADYAGNTAFGEPSDADASDDFILRYPQFTSSYNPNRSTPNWVSFVINATTFGSEDRCDCFTLDPALPSTFTQITTADYTGAGGFAGFGIDRGHMARSFDRTAASLDNAATYYFSNIVPQAADLNQGPWAILENELGDLARFQVKDVYVITGPAGNNGTLKNEGKIVYPTSTWKVAVILPRGTRLADLADYRDLQVIAVNMPNEPGVRNVPWQNYQTTVDAIEQLTGYDLLALLSDEIESAVESATQPPIARLNAPSSGAEGQPLALGGTGSLDPNGNIVSYEWNFGDGTSATGIEVTHIYVQDGTYTVTLKLTDNDGLITTVSQTVTVSNIAPTVSELPSATVNVGQTFTSAGTFTDPGADTWTATVNWGDGSAPSVANLTGRSFSLTHTYSEPGVYTVTVTVADDDASASRTQTVTVRAVSPAALLAAAKSQIDALVAANKLSRGLAAVLKSQLSVAETRLARGLKSLAEATLRAVIFELDLLVLLTPLEPADVAQLRALLLQVIAQID